MNKPHRRLPRVIAEIPRTRRTTIIRLYRPQRREGIIRVSTPAFAAFHAAHDGLYGARPYAIRYTGIQASWHGVSRLSPYYRGSARPSVRIVQPTSARSPTVDDGSGRRSGRDLGVTGRHRRTSDSGRGR